MLSLPPLSLYIHIPWCIRKCPYCDFNSHQAGDDLPEAAYVNALKADLDRDADLARGRPLTSIFFGGGTPSLFSAAAIGEILSHAQARLGFAEDIEITLEANPGTFEQEKFRGFRSAGVNRLSIGIQSFNNQHLQALGRVHDRAGAITAAASARDAGFDNFNLDLMHGLPGQSEEDALADLTTAIAMAPTHLSWYQLTIEPNTQFYKYPPQLPEDGVLENIQDAGAAMLAEAGFRQYEVSAFAKNNARSRHNLNYWQFGDYLGIGAGAHGKITLPHSGHIVRTAKTRAPGDYLSRRDDFLAQNQPIATGELALEFFMNALRLVEGVPAHYFSERTGLSLSAIQPAWSSLVEKGLVVEGTDRLTTTPKGFAFLNTVLELLDT